jgi:hypothetical protein
MPSDPYKGKSLHTTGYRKRHFSLQNVPWEFRYRNKDEKAQVKAFVGFEIY